MEIVGVYKKAIDRLALQAEKEGIEIWIILKKEISI
jgi:hypothetical protein